MTPEEAKHAADWITDAVSKNNNIFLIGSIAHSLLRIANAQEALHELSLADVNEMIEAEVKSRSETRAEEIVEEKSKRSFIGRKT